MASIRLKKEYKTEIMNSVMEDASKARMEALEMRERKVAMMCYALAIKGHEERIAKVPSGFYTEADNISVVLHKTAAALKAEKNGISYKRCALDTAYRSEELEPALVENSWKSHMELGKAVRMPAHLTHGKLRLTTKDPVAQEVLALIEAQKTLYEDLYSLHDTVKKALLECTTVKKLEEHYPELKKYLPAGISASQLAVAHGRIESLIDCTKEATCTDKPKGKKGKKPDVTAL